MTGEQYKVLHALEVGEGCTLWPMMRRAFLRQQWLKANGEPPTPSEKRRPRAPVRPYAVTRRGKAALRAHERELRGEPGPRGPLRMEFGKEDVSSGL